MVVSVDVVVDSVVEEDAVTAESADEIVVPVAVISFKGKTLDVDNDEVVDEAGSLVVVSVVVVVVASVADVVVLDG